MPSTDSQAVNIPVHYVQRQPSNLQTINLILALFFQVPFFPLLSVFPYTHTLQTQRLRNGINSLKTEDIIAVHAFGSCLFGRLTRSVCTGRRIGARRVEAPLGGMVTVCGCGCGWRWRYWRLLMRDTWGELSAADGSMGPYGHIK